MLSHKFDLRSIVGMALCALLSLVAFLTFLILMAYSNRFMAILGLTASLVCPTVWLMVLLSNDGGGGGGLVQWLKDRMTVLRPGPRRNSQPAGMPVKV